MALKMMHFGIIGLRKGCEKKFLGADLHHFDMLARGAKKIY